MLFRSINDNGPFGADVAQFIKNLLKKGWYKEVISEPKGKSVWRGMSVPNEWLRRALGGRIGKLKGSASVSFTYKPRSGGSSSWTTNVDRARGWGTGYGGRPDDDLIHITLKADIADNKHCFVSGPPGKGGGVGLYGVNRLNYHDDEAEAIGLGDIEVSEIEWEIFTDDDHDQKQTLGHINKKKTPSWSSINKKYRDKKSRVASLHKKIPPSSRT